MPPRLVVAFEPMKPVDLLVMARGVSSALKNNPFFPEPWGSCPTSLSQLDEAIELHQSNHLASLSGDHEKITMRNESHKNLSDRLSNVANFVEMVSFGDVKMLLSSGYEIRKPAGKPSGNSTPSAPNLSVKHGEVSGTLVAKANKTQGAASYELQVCTGDPTAEGNWGALAVYASSSRMLVEGREPGKVYSFRLRGIGRNGTGPWSLPFTIMSL